MDVYFSDYFHVEPRVLERYGAFNVSLVADLPLFIDPFLLFNSRKRKYRALHDRIIEYLRFLRDKSGGEDLKASLLKVWYRFPEVRQNWFGFSVDSNRGSGLGHNFALALHSKALPDGGVRQPVGLGVVFAPDVSYGELKRAGQLLADPMKGIEAGTAAGVFALHLPDHHFGIREDVQRLRL